MLGKLKELLKKYHGLILYLVFGVLTTVVNYIVYLPLYNICNFSATLSNVIAWIVAVFVAFVTNKPIVFKSFDWSFSVVWPELVKFVGCRLFSGILETALLWLTVDLLDLNGNIWKIVLSVLVIVINYIGSKFFVFKKK